MQRCTADNTRILRKIVTLELVVLRLAIRLRRERGIVGPARPLEATEFVVLHVVGTNFATLLEQHDGESVARQLTRHRATGNARSDHDEIHGRVGRVCRLYRFRLCFWQLHQSTLPSKAIWFSGRSYQPNGALCSIANSCPMNFQPT